jgi:transposase, IS30 family
MTAHYKHITQEQRYTISAELKSGKTLSAIAKDLGISRQTLWREIKRNKGERGYSPVLAHKNACARRPKVGSKINDFAKAFIAHKLTQHWSPAQISCALTAMGWKGVPSHEWIYGYVYSKQGQKDSLRSHLRCQKTYRKRGYKTRDRRGQLSKGTSIHERPMVIEARSRIGDIEGDTIIGKHHKGAALTLVDRKSLFVWITPLAHRYAQTTADACIAAMSAFRPHSITFDNGKEFAKFDYIAQRTWADVYFADAYCSNQRARNENTNGLIRQYLPKSIPLDNVCPKFVQHVAYELNNRPRKSLNWLTPAQVLAGITHVALRV